MFEQLRAPEIVKLVGMFSIIWFILGILIGKRLPRPSAARKNSRRKTPPVRRKQGGSEELYVGNLPYGVSEKDVRKTFERYGPVTSIRLIEHKNGKSKGYGFVEMGDKDTASSAIKGLNGKEFKGRSIVVSEARSSKRRQRADR